MSAPRDDEKDDNQDEEAGTDVLETFNAGDVVKRPGRRTPPGPGGPAGSADAPAPPG